MKTVKQGCATTIYCATSSDLKGKGGLYFSDCNVSNPIYNANNKSILKKLWSVSEKMTNIKFPNLKDNLNQSLSVEINGFDENLISIDESNIEHL
jgi:hypothetical protein